MILLLDMAKKSFNCHFLLLLVAVTSRITPVFVENTRNLAVTVNQTNVRCFDLKCPLSMICNPRTLACECKNPYLVPLDGNTPCLMRKYLGEMCIHSSQCAHIEHATCISNSKKRNELIAFTLKEVIVDALMLKHPEKYIPLKEWGRCDCRPGYWPNQSQRCEPKRLNSVQCSGSHQCPDHNSHCDIFLRKCVCDFGHIYDSIHDRCLLNLRNFCQDHADCQVNDDQARCFMGICTCINNHRFDPSQGCASVQTCKSWQTWNDFSKACEPTAYPHKPPIWTNLFERKKWVHLHVEVCFKLLLFFLVFVCTFVIMKKRITWFVSHAPRFEWRRASRANQTTSSGRGTTSVTVAGPQLSTAAQNGQEHSDRLRINITDLEEFEQNAMMSQFRSASGQCLSIDERSRMSNIVGVGRQVETDRFETELPPMPPPGYDRLPTYEEAVAHSTQIRNYELSASDSKNGDDQGNCQSDHTTENNNVSANLAIRNAQFVVYYQNSHSSHNEAAPNSGKN